MAPEVQLEIVGLLKETAFQIAKCIAEEINRAGHLMWCMSCLFEATVLIESADETSKAREQEWAQIQYSIWSYYYRV
ncbi:UNVERIFIED_CONTAM: hypothetical protein FKN15_034790 [Acipenser sinensis]